MRDLSGLDMAVLADLERKILWLATWAIHNANHLRPGTSDRLAKRRLRDPELRRRAREALLPSDHQESDQIARRLSPHSEASLKGLCELA